MNDILKEFDLMLKIIIIHRRNHKHLSVVLEVVQLLILNSQNTPHQSSDSFNKCKNQILDLEQFTEVHVIIAFEFEVILEQKGEP